MDIHHAMVVHNQPDRLYEALTQPRDLAVWMGADHATSRVRATTLHLRAFADRGDL